MILEILHHNSKNRILLLQAKHKQQNHIYANKVAWAKNLSLHVMEQGNSSGTERGIAQRRRIISAPGG
jgi:hypothetical protein